MKRLLRWTQAPLGLLLALLVLVSGPSAQPATGRLEVHFIDVAQADAILIINAAKDCVILIDSGESRSKRSKDSFRAYLGQQIPPNGSIDLVISSHPHSDHIGSMQWVFETYRVKTYIDSGHAYESTLYERLMAVVKGQRQTGQLAYHRYGSVPASAETVCGGNSPRLRTLYPRQGLDDDLCEQNANNCSVVTKLTFGQTNFLFPGDAEEEQEELLLGDPDVKKQLDADVLKVPHHGSDTSSSPEFLEAVSPTWMIVSAGKKDEGTNKGYKHPRLSTVRQLLGFAGDRADPRTIDVYDATKKKWTKVQIWGRLYVTAKDETVELSSDGSRIQKQ